MIKGIVAALFLALAMLIPFNYYSLVKFSVIDLSAGWVFSTVYLRFLCIVFFVIALFLVFSLFKRTSRIKFIFVFLIGLAPGFAISFISPIYKTDYGDFSDDLTLENTRILKEYTKGAYDAHGKRHLVGFFSTDCGHCRNTASKIGINQTSGQSIEVHAFFAEQKEDIMEFINNCNGAFFSIYQMGNPDLFLSISGFELPSIFLIDRDGSTIKHWKGDVVNYTALDYLSDVEP